jgi:chloramphenicol O-acetyltransferase
VTGNFREGFFEGNGNITINNHTIIRVEKWQSRWNYGTYMVSASLVLVPSSLEKKTNFLWEGDGTRLIIQKNDQSQESITFQDIQNLSQNATQSLEDPKYQLFYILSTLKWFEFQFLHSKPISESEAYTFEQVDIPPSSGKMPTETPPVKKLQKEL